MRRDGDEGVEGTGRGEGEGGRGREGKSRHKEESGKIYY